MLRVAIMKRDYFRCAGVLALSILAFSCNSQPQNQPSPTTGTVPNGTPALPEKILNPSPSPSASPTGTPPQYTVLGKMGSFYDSELNPRHWFNSDGSVTLIASGGSAYQETVQILRFSKEKGIEKLFETKAGEYSSTNDIHFIDQDTIFILNFQKTHAAFIYLNLPFSSAYSEEVSNVVSEGGSFAGLMVSVLPNIGVVLANSHSYRIITKDLSVDQTVTPQNPSFVELGYYGLRARVDSNRNIFMESQNLDGLEIYSPYPQMIQKIALGKSKTDSAGKVVKECTFFTPPQVLPSGNVLVNYTNAYDDSKEEGVSYFDQVQGHALLKKNADGKFGVTDLSIPYLDTDGESDAGSYYPGKNAVELSDNTIVLHGNVKDPDTQTRVQSVVFFDSNNGQLKASFIPRKKNEAIKSLQLLKGDQVVVRTDQAFYIIDSSGKLLAEVTSFDTRFDQFHELADGRIVFAPKGKMELDAVDPATGVVNVFKKLVGICGDGSIINLNDKTHFLYIGSCAAYEAGWGLNNLSIVDGLGNSKDLNLNDASIASAYFVPPNQNEGMYVFGASNANWVSFK